MEGDIILFSKVMFYYCFITRRQDSVQQQFSFIDFSPKVNNLSFSMILFLRIIFIRA